MKTIKFLYFFNPETDREIKNFDGDKVVARVYRFTEEKTELSDTAPEGEEPQYVTTKHDTEISVSFDPETPVEDQEVARLLATANTDIEVFYNGVSIGMGTVATL